MDDDFVAGVPDAVGHEFEVTNGKHVLLGRICPAEETGCSAARPICVGDPARRRRARGWRWAFLLSGLQPGPGLGLLQTSEYAAAVLRLGVDFFGTPYKSRLEWPPVGLGRST